MPLCGVLYNYDEAFLIANGFMKCYDQPYSANTKSADLDACSGSPVVFVGAKGSNLTTKFTIGAFGTSNIFTQTSSNRTAYLDPGGAYWYRFPNHSFGFASSSSVNLSACDYGQGPDDCASRLCWHLDENIGGYRAGCMIGLNNNSTWRKAIYKGNILITCLTGNFIHFACCFQYLSTCMLTCA